MKAFLLILAIISTNAFSADIPEWDIPALEAEGRVQGWTFKPRASWVTEHLRRGGRLRELTGLKKPANANATNIDDLAPMLDLPKSWDWRVLSSNWLQPIRNQASCGSCWAFSVTSVIEGLIKLKLPEAKVNLAEQTLVSSCSNSGSCSGGYFSAFDYIQQEGLPDEGQDPYLAQNSRCKSGLTPNMKIKRWAYVGRNPSTEQIKTAMMMYGPISVDVNGGFGSYGEGIYNRCGSTSTNHMVTLEGWVDDPAYAEYGNGYWIMRNSWGSGWGESGYMRIVYKSKAGRNCNGIGNVAAYAVLDDSWLDKVKEQK